MNQQGRNIYHNFGIGLVVNNVAYQIHFDRVFMFDICIDSIFFLSALDLRTSQLVEKVIRSLGLSVIWATRDIYQAERVADSVMEFSQLTHVDVGAAAGGASSSSSSSDHLDELDEFELEYLIHEAVEAQAEAARIAASVEASVAAEAEVQQQEHEDRLRAFQATHGDLAAAAVASPARNVAHHPQPHSHDQSHRHHHHQHSDADEQKYSQEDGQNVDDDDLKQFRPVAQHDDDEVTSKSSTSSGSVRIVMSQSSSDS
jgi:hypothetical protein